MIKANELRLGNYIILKGVLTFVTAQDFARYYGKFSGFSEFEPIELTFDWLLKFGFKQDSDLKNSFCRFGIWFNKNNMEATYLSQKLIKIKYVHQLQNLFFSLVGEELVFSTEP
jgi:hypothetical protein